MSNTRERCQESRYATVEVPNEVHFAQTLDVQ
jgi:hypothetical protein